MLKLKNLFESDEVAECMLRHYQFSEVKKGFCRASSNVVYWVVGDGNLYFLRYTTEDERSKEEIYGELAVVLHVREHGSLANRPVKTKEGDYLIQENGYLAVLFEGVKGKRLEDITLSTDIAGLWGTELGKIHKVLNGYRLPEGTNRPDYHDRFAFIRNILRIDGDQELIANADSLEQAFDSIIKTQDNYGLCHYDFEVDNVFFDDGSGQLSVIDFDDTMYHFYAVDLMQAIDNIKQAVKGDYKSIETAFLDGYTSQMPLPSKRELEMSKQFILLLGYANLAYCLAYCLAYPPESESVPEWMEELTVKFKRAMESKRKALLFPVDFRKDI